MEWWTLFIADNVSDEKAFGIDGTTWTLESDEALPRNALRGRLDFFPSMGPFLVDSTMTLLGLSPTFSEIAAAGGNAIV